MLDHSHLKPFPLVEPLLALAHEAPDAFVDASLDAFKTVAAWERFLADVDEVIARTPDPRKLGFFKAFRLGYTLGNMRRMRANVAGALADFHTRMAAHFAAGQDAQAA